MNEAPKGKIGRLPRAIQEQVNRRLENGEKARKLVARLYALPKVSAMLAAECAGAPLREQNLSDWHLRTNSEIHRLFLHSSFCLLHFGFPPNPPVFGGWPAGIFRA